MESSSLAFASACVSTTVVNNYKKMKEVLVIIFFGVFINSYSQNIKDFSPHYITGNSVNVRFEPNLGSEIYYQSNWGEQYLAKKINSDWYQIFGYEDEILYVSQKYLKPESEFIEEAKKVQLKNSKTELLLFKHYLRNENQKEAIKLVDKLINTPEEKTILIGFEQCDLVSHSAYKILKENLTNDNLRIQIHNKIQNQTILNLIELDQIEKLIKENKYQDASKKLNKILTETCEFLYLPIGCDYDADSKVYPQLRFKTLYFINYHLSEFEEKRETLKFLRAIRDYPINKKCKNMAQDIYTKLFYAWNID